MPGVLQRQPEGIVWTMRKTPDPGEAHNRGSSALQPLCQAEA